MVAQTSGRAPSGGRRSTNSLAPRLKRSKMFCVPPVSGTTSVIGPGD